MYFVVLSYGVENRLLQCLDLLFVPRSINLCRTRPFDHNLRPFGMHRITVVLHRAINDRILKYPTTLRPLVTVYDTAIYGRDTVQAKTSNYGDLRSETA